MTQEMQVCRRVSVWWGKERALLGVAWDTLTGIPCATPGRIDAGSPPPTDPSPHPSPIPPVARPPRTCSAARSGRQRSQPPPACGASGAGGTSSSRMYRSGQYCSSPRYAQCSARSSASAGASVTDTIGSRQPPLRRQPGAGMVSDPAAAAASGSTIEGEPGVSIGAQRLDSRPSQNTLRAASRNRWAGTSTTTSVLPSPPSLLLQLLLPSPLLLLLLPPLAPCRQLSPQLASCKQMTADRVLGETVHVIKA